MAPQVPAQGAAAASEDEWVLVLGDVGIPEWAGQIPRQFLKLIQNLRSNEQRKSVACTGNLGSNGAELFSFFKSLVVSSGLENDQGTNRVHIVRGILPSPPSVPEKEWLHFEAAGVRIGVVGTGHISEAPWRSDDNEPAIFPDAQSLFGNTPVDIVITGGAKPLIQKHDGFISLGAPLYPYIRLCPGSLTGRSPFSPIGKAFRPAGIYMAKSRKNEQLSHSREDQGVTIVSPPRGPAEPSHIPEDQTQPPTDSSESKRRPQPSFMLLRATRESLVLFLYRLNSNEEVEVQEIDLGHPRPLVTPQPQESTTAVAVEPLRATAGSWC